MAAIKLLTFEDIYSAVLEEMGIPSSDTTRLNRAKRDINVIYQQVAGYKRWWWLIKHTAVTHQAKYTTGTASVTAGSASITLSDAPASTDGESGSFLDYKLKIQGHEEIYDITAHTALATSVTIRSAFTGDTNATASFTIWKDHVDLPTDCREVLEVWSDRKASTMEGLGPQEFRQWVIANPTVEDFPDVFSQYDQKDPSSGDGETESDRFRIMRIFPSISTEDVTVNIDYILEISELENTTDEPLIPIEDRVVLVYGALAKMWAKERDPEESNRNWQLYSAQLQRMAGRTPDGLDKPRIGISTGYIAHKRGRVRRWVSDS